MTPHDERAVDVSVVICTFNRADALRLTLGRLAAVGGRTEVRHEVIVADNASTDATPNVLAGFSDAMPLVRVHEARKGAAAARNAALAVAKGRYVFVVDDDCMIADDWFEAGMDLLRENPRQVVGGWIGLHDARDLPLTVKLEEEPARLLATANLLGFLHGCNVVMGRCVLDEIGTYDPLFGPGSSTMAADDTDLVYRAFVAGVPVLYDPRLRVTHNHGRRGAAARDALDRAYETSIGALAMKHALRGRVDLLRALYWRMLPGRGHSLAMKAQLVRGAAAYLWAAVREPRPRRG